MRPTEDEVEWYEFGRVFVVVDVKGRPPEVISREETSSWPGTGTISRAMLDVDGIRSTLAVGGSSTCE